MSVERLNRIRRIINCLTEDEFKQLAKEVREWHLVVRAETRERADRKGDDA